MDNRFEFLDLTDLNDHEREELDNLLYTDTKCVVELPPEPGMHWISPMHPSITYSGEPLNGNTEVGIENLSAEGTGDEEYGSSPIMQNVVATTVQSVFPMMPPPNVYVGNMTANVNVHGLFPQAMPYSQIFTQPLDSPVPNDARSSTNPRKQRPVKPSAKRPNDARRGMETPQGNFTPPFTQPFPQQYVGAPIPFVPTLSGYPPQPTAIHHIPSPQQATGRPIFLPPTLPIYPHQPQMFPGYASPAGSQVVFSPQPQMAPPNEQPPPEREMMVTEECPTEQINFQCTDAVEPVYQQQTSEEEEHSGIVDTVIVENTKLLQNINISEESSVNVLEENFKQENPNQELKAKSTPENAIKTTQVPSQKPPFASAKQKRSSVSDEVPVVEPTPQQHNKSWASLFNDKKSVEPSTPALHTERPLARVNPLQNNTAVTTTISTVTNTDKPMNDSVNSTHHVNSISGSQAIKSPSHLPNPEFADDPNLHRLGEFLTHYQLEHKAVSLQPRGLTNRSNYCYINATLQALIACPPFYNLMKSMPVSPPSKSGKSHTPIIDSMVQFVNEFIPMPLNARLGKREKAQARKEGEGVGSAGAAASEISTGPAFEPSYIYKMLNVIRNDTAFQVEGRQEDAEEFLSCLLNGLNDEMLELVKLAEPPGNNLTNGDLAANGNAYQDSEMDCDQNTEWKEVVNKSNRITRRAEFGRTPLSAIFRGHLRSRVTRAGNESTDNVQPFFTLPLDIEKAQSVKEALDILVGKDPVLGVTCSKTNQEVEAWQQVSLDELPLVLLLHLKCFDYKLHTCSKIVKTVEFPIDLKVEQKLLSNKSKNKNSTVSKDRQYKLFAVVYHDGKEATKGHYVTDVFHVGYSGWVRYDDATVRPVTEQQVLKPKGPRVPYLLYYRRCDTISSPHDKNR